MPVLLTLGPCIYQLQEGVCPTVLVYNPGILCMLSITLNIVCMHVVLQLTITGNVQNNDNYHFIKVHYNIQLNIYIWTEITIGLHEPNNDNIKHGRCTLR